MDKQETLSLLYQAYGSPLGIIVRSSAAAALRQKLSAARRDDPDLSILSILHSPLDPQGEVWILRKELRNEDEERA